MGRSKRRSKNRSMAANGGMVGRRLAEGPHRTPPAPHRTIRVPDGVPPAEGRERPCAILSPLFGAPSPELVQRTSPGDSMPEILTESFCERCGTRYTFESATPRGPRLKGLKVMSRGLKNFVLSDDTSMDEAMAAARNETDREQTSQQLDAFHKTFNFCMSCRQYTCGNCWNEAEGRCLSCAPHLGHEVLPAPFGNVAAGGAVTLTGPEAIGLHDRNGNGAEAAATAEPMAWPEAEQMAWPEPEPMAWPTSDLARDESAADGPETFQEAIDAAARLASVAGPADVEPAVDEVAADVDEVVAEVAPLEAEVPPLEAAIEAELEQIEPIAPAADVAPPMPAAAAETARRLPLGTRSTTWPRRRPRTPATCCTASGRATTSTTRSLHTSASRSAAASAAMAAAADTAAAEADAAEAAAARAAAEARWRGGERSSRGRAGGGGRGACVQTRRLSGVAAEQATRAAADAEARACQAAEAEARAAAEAQARAAAEEQPRLAAEAEEAAARRAAAEPAARGATRRPRVPADLADRRPGGTCPGPAARAAATGLPAQPIGRRARRGECRAAMAEPAGMAATAIGRGSSVPGSTTRRERWHRGPVGRVRP